MVSARRLLSARKGAREGLKGYSRTVLGLFVPTKPRIISKSGFNAFRPIYNEHHDPDLNYPIWSTDITTSILHTRTRQRIWDRPRDCLWWTVSMTLKNGGKHTVRKWCIRRTRIALVQALEASGLDKDGRRIKPQSDEQQAGPQLWGSLHLALNSSALTLPFTTIQEETRRLVKMLLERPFTRPSERSDRRNPPARNQSDHFIRST